MTAAIVRDAAALLAEGFAEQVAAWATPETAPLARAAARELSLATSDGHTCVPLASVAASVTPPPPIETLRSALLASGVVGPAHAPGSRPMVLDDADRLYLHRLFDGEQRLARAVAGLVAQPAGPLDATAVALLAELFPRRADTEVDWQHVAAALALRQRLTVISGGPGTGKTTTVVAVLAGLLARDPDTRIALAAPTGKAAARMTEAIRGRAGSLPDPLRARLPAEAYTVHRLLGASPQGFRHRRDNPLPFDALVVDEASMLDLEMATRLFEALPAHARLVLLGDKDQLAAVESGAVFAELGANPALGDACRADLAQACGVAPAALQPPTAAAPGMPADMAVWFTRNYRFGEASGIGRAAVAIRDGRADTLMELLRQPAAEDLRWLSERGAEPTLDQVGRALSEGLAPYLAALARDPGDIDAIAAALGRFRVLAATREGPLGVQALNRLATRIVRQAVAPAPVGGGRWFVGEPLMVLRNDAALRVFNGDIGLVAPAADGQPCAMFATPEGDWRGIPLLRLPEHETAFAVTVHKSQGSEFDEVLVLLPEQARRALSRELLYTAITRARRSVVLAASESAIRHAVASPTRRHSGLIDRLREATAAQGTAG